MGPAYLGGLPADPRDQSRADGRGPARSLCIRPCGAGLREGLAYLWDTPSSLAALWLAFLVNLTAYPLTSGLLPFVARDIYHTDQTDLCYLIASFAFGAVLGSVAISMAG